MLGPSRAAASSAGHETSAQAHHAGLASLRLAKCTRRCSVSSSSQDSRGSRNKRSTYMYCAAHSYRTAEQTLYFTPK